ncbi:MAG TPA: hypothetical protein VK027_01585 [Chitinophagaceae bacterium]|nr:hypothetical protein [Chitinophagaceae bacterium]
MSIYKNSSYIIICILLFFTACRKTKDGELIPPITTEEMGIILLELQFAEMKSIGNFSDSLLLDNKKKQERNFDSLAYYYQEILERHDIDFKLFKEYMSWYKNNAKFLDSALHYAVNKMEEIYIDDLSDEEKDFEEFKMENNLKAKDIEDLQNSLPPMLKKAPEFEQENQEATEILNKAEKEIE